MKFYLILFALLLTTAIGCRKEIQLKPSEKEPRLVVNAFLKNTDTCWVHLSQSSNVLSNEIGIIENGSVELLDQSNISVGEFNYSEGGFYYLSTPDGLSVNSFYTLNVTSPNLKSVTAKTSIPTIPNLVSIDTVSLENELQFNFLINDPIEAVNYYSISIIYHGFPNSGEAPYTSSVMLTNQLIVESETQRPNGVELSASEFIFSDKTFNGQSLNFICQSIMPADDIGFYVFKLKALNEDLFKHKISRSKYLSNQDSPLSEPTIVFSNIENGLGIFGGLSVLSDTLYKP